MTAPTPRTRILVVTGQTSTLTLLRVSLDAARYELDVAGDAREALRLILRNAYDVIVSTFEHEKMDGLELLQFAARRQPNTYRVLLSGSDRSAEEALALHTGKVDRIFRKPFCCGALIECLRGAPKKTETLDGAEKFRTRVSAAPSHATAA